MLAAVQTVQTKVQIVQTKSVDSADKVQTVQTKVQAVQTEVQTKCNLVYTRKMIDYQHFKTKSVECRQKSKNYVEEV